LAIIFLYNYLNELNSKKQIGTFIMGTFIQVNSGNSTGVQINVASNSEVSFIGELNTTAEAGQTKVTVKSPAGTINLDLDEPLQPGEVRTVTRGSTTINISTSK
jgi:hypothetical protein